MITSRIGIAQDKKGCFKTDNSGFRPRKGFVLIGVVALFAVLVLMMTVLAQIEAHSRKRVQNWELQERLDRLALSAIEVAKFRLLGKALPDTGSLETGMGEVVASWSIGPDPRGGFILKGHARTPIDGVIKFQSQKAIRFLRNEGKDKEGKDKVVLVPEG